MARAVVDVVVKDETSGNVLCELALQLQIGFWR